jgi:outer membrane protein OmpA-like peptidoglycan-associated protein
MMQSRALVLIVSLGLGPGLASAADPAAAEVHFTRGRELVAEGALVEACGEFRRSHTLDPAVGTLLNLAECEERRGQLAVAWSTWLAAAAEATALGQGERATLARARAAALTPRLGTLTVRVPLEAALEGLRMTRDGVELDGATWGQEAPIDPGEHVLIASAPRHADWKVVVSTSAGLDVSVQVPPLEPDAEEASPGVATQPTGASRAQRGVLLPIAGLLTLLVLCIWILRARRGSAASLSEGASRRPGDAPWLPLLVCAGGLSLLIGGLGHLGRGKGGASSGALPEAEAPPRDVGLEVVRVAGDPWSGYSTFRGEPRLKSALAQKGIALEYLDDPELYDQDKRMQALAEGKLHLALTTIDAFLQHGAKHRVNGRYPGVIVWNVDESDGGDAIFLTKGRAGFDSVQATDRVCYAAGTPSEHLWDFASLAFDRLNSRLQTDNGVVASDCWKKLEAGQVQIAVLWQPSTAIAVKAGYPKVFATGGQADDVIIDVVVANREYLSSHRATVTEVARAYFETIDWQLSHPEEHAQLITRDCGPDCEGSIELGRAVLEGIDFLTYEENSCLWWGRCGTPAKLGERIEKTGRLLAAKGKILNEELPAPASILDDGCLASLEAAGAPHTAVQTLQVKASEKRYSYVASATSSNGDGDVGTLRLPSIYFPEARADLDQNAASVVEVIADQLRAFPALCVRIHGHTNSAGNPANNLMLSEARAHSIASHLSRLDPDVFPLSRFDVRGLGSTAPVKKSNLEEDLAASRRTEFKLFHCQQRRSPGEPP